MHIKFEAFQFYLMPPSHVMQNYKYKLPDYFSCTLIVHFTHILTVLPTLPASK